MLRFIPPWFAGGVIRKFLLWLAGILWLLDAAVMIAFRLSPWPGVAIINDVFAKGDQASEAPGFGIWMNETA